MNGRSTVVILFFWALLTVITPALIRMSASAKLLDVNGVEASAVKSRLLPRRALIATKFIETPAPTPAPTPEPGTNKPVH
ncbi:hypothetical protein DCAR_0623682 [Daucus carota subsp. sativus]|uniref:Transmembrane protein n=1 Tax=Daucus carota subsp. sativus TaxID=79200 RepID=A0AAF0XAG2_DAUCS|nr:hypothetical protein DCAR_0623682 [Daucus carota subsp. sativus]